LPVKALIEDSTGIGISEMRILHKGRALRDDDTLEGAGVAEDAQLYVALHSGVSPSAELNASSFVPQPGQPPPGADDPLAGLLNSPIMQGMLDNPEVLRSMVQANPGMREVMDNNPELAQMLNDPSVLRQSLASARNPQLMREMMRNTDRAMSNIEAHPGGHNALRRMYQTVQAPLYDAAAPSTLGGADGSEQQHQQTPPPPATGPNTSALPNPWARPAQPSPMGGMGFPMFGGRGGFPGRGMGGWPGGGRGGGRGGGGGGGM
jgi:ubiquilin